jgi:biotin operon repressor
MTSLGPALDKLECLLTAARGEFVGGQILAKATGVPMIALSNFIGQLRAKRPGVVIEGKRGKGYRLASAPAPEANMPAVAAPTATATVTAPTANQRTAAAMSLLDLLRPRTAELVKTIALESGETADACVARLIAYGAEVHHSLVGDGENPVGLPRPRAAEQPTRH